MSETLPTIQVPFYPGPVKRKPLSVDLMLCCNNEHGISRGRFDAMDIATAAGVEVELRDFPPTLVRDFMREQVPMVQIGRWKFRRLYFAANHGNLLWDCYGVPHDAAFESLIRSLARRGARPEALSVRDSLGLEPVMENWLGLVLLKPTAGRTVSKTGKRVWVVPDIGGGA